MILIVSHPRDDHAAAVLGELAVTRQPAVLLDTSLFPREGTLTQRFDRRRSHFEFRIAGRPVDLDDCRVGWWRRPQPYALHSGISPDAAEFAYTECHEAVTGAWAGAGMSWVNRPELDEVAHHKPYQLATAVAVGLPVPRTLVTNDPGEARAFIDEIGVDRTVYKTFLASEHCWRETRILRPEEIGLLDRLPLAPVIFQEYVPADADIRVTVFGPRIFAAAITPAPGGYQVDYRMDMEGARFTSTELPEAILGRLRMLMDRLGLVYGAIDLRRTPDGEYVFLEINPAGEWRFIEQRTGQPLTRAMADLLINLDCPRPPARYNGSREVEACSSR